VVRTFVHGSLHSVGGATVASASSAFARRRHCIVPYVDAVLLLQERHGNSYWRHWRVRFFRMYRCTGTPALVDRSVLGRIRVVAR
jgi:hypothetical protein